MRLSLALLATMTVLSVAQPADASSVSSDGDDSDGTVTIVAGSPPIVGPSGGGSTSRCSWDALYWSRDPDNDLFVEGDLTFGFDASNPPVIREVDGVSWRLYSVSCPGELPAQRWVRIGVRVGDLIPGLVDVVQGRLPLPVPAVNPSPADGGVVNLGMWLAVEPQTFDPLSAEAGSSWITVSPKLVATEFDFGNGDTITCDGIGVAIRDAHPDLDVVGQSPTCGYTYRRSSPDDAPYRLVVTTIWELPYTSSGGAGSIPPLRRSITVDYDVDEIQTLGVAN